jgi:hypothetical protein
LTKQILDALYVFNKFILIGWVKPFKTED